VQRAEADNSNHSNAIKIIEAQSFAELWSHLETNVEAGNFIFRLSELHFLYQERLHDLGVNVTVNKTRLKLSISPASIHIIRSGDLGGVWCWQTLSVSAH